MSKALSPQTQNALNLITDPYHDFNLRGMGYPDGSAIATAIRRTTYRHTIICPFTLAAGQSWDFHVYATPLHFLTSCTGVSMAGQRLLGDSAKTVSIGPINVMYRLYDPSGNIVQTTYRGLGSTNDDADAVSGNNQFRTVALAFELHNATAKLNLSGTLTMYRSPPVHTPVNLYYSDDVITTLAQFNATMINRLPGTIDDANLLPNSITLEAERGAYCTTLPTPENPFCDFLPTNIIMRDGIGTNNYLIYRRPDPSQATSPGSVSWSPIAPAGVFSSRFTDVMQSYQLDVRQTLEVQTSANSTILPYAFTAPEYDKRFLDVYRAMFNNIPVGASVYDNASGDWFKTILSVAKEALPSIAAVLPPQLKPIAVAAVPALQGFIDKILNGPGTLESKADAIEAVATNTRSPEAKKALAVIRKRLAAAKGTVPDRKAGFQAGTQRVLTSQSRKKHR